MIPVKGEEPGAFVLTSRRDGQKYVMSAATLQGVLDKLNGEREFDALFTGEWVVLTEEERQLAAEIRKG